MFEVDPSAGPVQLYRSDLRMILAAVETAVMLPVAKIPDSPQVSAYKAGVTVVLAATARAMGLVYKPGVE